MQFKFQYVLKHFLPSNGCITFSRLNSIKKFAIFFSSLTSHAINLLLRKKILSLILYKIITVSRPNTLLMIFLMERSWCPTKGGNFWEGSPSKSKSLNFPLLLDITLHQKIESPCPSLDHSSHIGKKNISLIAFRPILPKILPAACIFSYTIMICLKKLIGTKSLNKNQCPTELFLIIISRYPPKHLWEILGMEETPSNSQKFTHFPHQKNFP